jgi:predicted TIM-barrel fold metal-dependent hydrolase
MQVQLGLDRAVMVQPSAYGSDHRALLDALREAPRSRGVAVLGESTSDDELVVLHRAGVRGARFNFGGRADGGLTRTRFERDIRRIERLGWHAKIGGAAASLMERFTWFEQLQLPVVLDHLGGVEREGGLAQPLFQMNAQLLARDNAWILLSNADRKSRDPDGLDMAPYLREYLRLAPERSLWASDWPHLLYPRQTPPEDRALLALLREVADEQTCAKVLIHNPARLYGQ